MRKRPAFLADWYKPTKRGEKARQWLMREAEDKVQDILPSAGVMPAGQAGAVGENVDKIEKDKPPK